MLIYLDTNHWANLLDKTNKDYERLSEIALSSEEYIFLFSELNFLELTQHNDIQTVINRGLEIQKYNLQYLCNTRRLLTIEALNYMFNFSLTPYTKYFTELANNLDSRFNKFSIRELFYITANDTYKNLLKRSNQDAMFDRIKPFIKNQTRQMSERYDLFEQKLIAEKLKEALIKIGIPNKFLLEKDLPCSSFPSFSIPFFSQHANQRDTSFNLNWNSAVDYNHGSYVPYSDLFITDKNNAHVIKISLKKLNDLNDVNFITTKIGKNIDILLNN